MQINTSTATTDDIITIQWEKVILTINYLIKFQNNISERYGLCVLWFAIDCDVFHVDRI